MKVYSLIDTVDTNKGRQAGKVGKSAGESSARQRISVWNWENPLYITVSDIL